MVEQFLWTFIVYSVGWHTVVCYGCPRMVPSWRKGDQYFSALSRCTHSEMNQSFESACSAIICPHSSYRYAKSEKHETFSSQCTPPKGMHHAPCIMRLMNSVPMERQPAVSFTHA